jgi:hypothetical protein
MIQNASATTTNFPKQKTLMNTEHIASVFQVFLQYTNLLSTLFGDKFKKEREKGELHYTNISLFLIQIYI